MPLLTHYDAAARSSLWSAAAVRRLGSADSLSSPPTRSDSNKPPARIPSCFTGFGSDNGSHGCAPVAPSTPKRTFGKNRASARAQCSRCLVAKSRAGRCRTMRLEIVLKLLPCVVFLLPSAMHAQAGKKKNRL